VVAVDLVCVCVCVCVYEGLWVACHGDPPSSHIILVSLLSYPCFLFCDEHRTAVALALMILVENWSCTT
jgi:hypothetical protein